MKEEVTSILRILVISKMWSLHIKDIKISNAMEMLNQIKPGVHGSWKDDYIYWSKEHKEKYLRGKVFPIDLKEKESEQIFFDDNAVDKQIIHVQTTEQHGFTQQDSRSDYAKMVELLRSTLIRLC